MIRNRAWLPLAIAFLAGCTTPAGGKWPAEGAADRGKASPPAKVTAAADLRLQASFERDSYLLGEPVYLLLRLENSGAQARRVFGSLNPSDRQLEVIVGGPDKRERRFVPLVEADHDQSIMVQLAPGATLGAVAPVFFGAEGWTFPTPGRYVVTATYRTGAGKGEVVEARSAPVGVEVRSTGDGAGEFLVGTTASSLEAGKFLAWQAGDHLAAGREHLESLIQRYPRSELSHYARSALSRSYGRRFTDYRTRQVRAPDCKLALEYLRLVAEERLPGYVRMQNALTRARCAARAQDNAAARAAIQDAHRLAGDRPEYRGLAAQAQELERTLGKPPR
jgi:hypothetical protein